MEIKLAIILVYVISGIFGKSLFIKNLLSQNIKITKQHCIENQQTPHETKCNLYYRCVYGRKIVKICPDGMFFNQNIENCDSSYNVACGSLETSQDDNKFYGDFDYYESFDLNSSYQPTTREADINECPEKEDPYEPNALLPHEERCNAFYKCLNGIKYLMKCPGILQFNPKVSACDWPMNVRCVNKNLVSSTTTDITQSTTQLSTNKIKKIKRSIENSNSKPIECNCSRNLSDKINGDVSDTPEIYNCNCGDYDIVVDHQIKVLQDITTQSDYENYSSETVIEDKENPKIDVYKFSQT